MHLDVVELRRFYYATPLGRAAQRALQAGLRRLWPETRDETVAGFGFAQPVLRPFLADARRVVGLMPAQQGVMPWPAGQPNLSVLVEETAWPLEAGGVDRLILLHGLETCDAAGALLDEVWRVLAPAGRVVFMVPNRAGLWARRDATPFGFGRPYSFGQLEAQLARHRFQPERHGAALYWPPSHRGFWVRSAPWLERVGRRIEPQMLAGVLMVEATKQVFARPRSGNRATIPGPLDVLEGLTKPKPTPEPAGARGRRG